MTRHRVSLLAGAIAAIAFVGAPARAIDFNVGGVGISSGGGSGGGVHAGTGANAGGNNAANATADLDEDGVDIDLDLLKLKQAAGHAATSDIDVGLGQSTGTSHATVDLNDDGVINADDDAQLVLDVNGDGVLSILDDANGDGIVSTSDLGIDLNGLGDSGADADLDPGDGIVGADIGGVGGAVSLGGGGSPDGLGAPPSQIELGRAFGNIDDNEVAALKLKCADVLGNPAGFDAATVSVCQALASL